jgi:hypothetical protein
MNGSLDPASVLCFVIAFEVALLGVTGVLHLVRPEPLRTAARAHRSNHVIPAWLGALERPALVGATELLLAVGVVASLVPSATWAELVAQILVATYAAVLWAFLSLLRRAGTPLPCGCHPLAGNVTRASCVPAAALLTAATISTIGIERASGLALSPATQTVLAALLGALTAATVLVYSGAASDPLRPEATA